MTWGYVAVGAGILISGYLTSESNKDAAASAAEAQTGAAESGISESRAQFEAIQQLLMPYTNAGSASLQQQQALIGLNGPEAQQNAIDELQKSPAFTAMAQQGENAILQNASATGGLRGGNVQGALAQFKPKLLADLIQQRFQNLQTITGTGVTAASSLGGYGQQTSAQIANLMGQQGSAAAGQALATGAANAGLNNTVAQLGGVIGASQGATL